MSFATNNLPQPPAGDATRGRPMGPKVSPRANPPRPKVKGHASGNHVAGGANHVGVPNKGTINRPNKSITISKKTMP